jgi:hypothetical protein
MQAAMRKHNPTADIAALSNDFAKNGLLMLAWPRAAECTA